MHATLDEFLDRQRTGLASTFLTRLRSAPSWSTPRAVPALYSGRVRAWHLWLVLLAGLLALAAAIGVTPVGQEWVDELRPALTDLLDQRARTLLVISFRHHVVSLVAVFLALAVGIVLGGGPLSEVGRADGATDGGRPADRRADRRGSTPPPRRPASRTSSPPALGAGAVRGLLDGRAVAIVVLPGRRREGRRRARPRPCRTPAAPSTGSTPCARRWSTPAASRWSTRSAAS